MQLVPHPILQQFMQQLPKPQFIPKCPECADQGMMPDRIYRNGGHVSTDLPPDSFYDAYGWHEHDPNIVIMKYRCTNNHQWQQEVPQTCWCGWSNQREEQR